MPSPDGRSLPTLSRRTIVAYAALLPVQAAAQQGNGAAVSPMGFGAVGDGRADDTAALRQALAAGARSGTPVLLDRWYKFSGVLELPPLTRLLGKDIESCGLVHDGSGDGLVISSACSIDNFTVDGGRPAGTSRLNSVRGALVGIHGAMSAGASSYLSGVKIGRLRIRHTGVRAALCIANVESLIAEEIALHDCWGIGILMAGVKNSRFDTIKAMDIGNLLPSGSRWGIALAIFPERDAGKQPAGWYVQNAELPTSNLSFGQVEVRSTTDTAIYLHDYDQNPEGVSLIRFSSIKVENAGKDGFKVRQSAHDVSVETLSVRNTALRGATLEELSFNITIGLLDVANIGVNTVAGMPGTDASLLGPNFQGTAISNDIVGLNMQNVRNVRINKANISDIHTNEQGTYGFGVFIQDSRDISLNATIANTDRIGARITHLENFNLSFDISNVCRTADTDAVLMYNGGSGDNSNGRLRLNVQNDNPSILDLRLAGNSSNIQVTGTRSARIDPSAEERGVTVTP